ncbi:MAG: hypothetical protein SFX73_09135 [Kofleriaceae bacterium]|nr:hypothetical protein [Kofleriaceae bacterium]
MRKLAVPIFVFSILGLVAMFLPMERGSMAARFAEFDQFRLVLMLAGFIAPAVVAVLSLKRPVTSWMPYVALGGYAVATVKSEVWSLATKLPSSPLPFTLLFIAIVSGVVVSIIAFAKQEEANAAATS